jgi:predicted nucleic acid-binding protein
VIYLFDVNFLIAVLDVNHVHSPSAHRWLSAKRDPIQWASCPLTENAFVRITGNPAYANSLGSGATALALLKKNCSETKHHFWADTISLRDEALWNKQELMSPSHLTDCYSLALAVKNRGKLASFDRHIPAHLMRGGKEALLLLPA